MREPDCSISNTSTALSLKCSTFHPLILDTSAWSVVDQVNLELSKSVVYGLEHALSQYSALCSIAGSNPANSIGHLLEEEDD